MSKVIVTHHLTLDGVMQAPARPDEDIRGDYYLFHAIRADLLRRLGRTAEASLSYEAAIARAENATERAFLGRSHQALTRA